MFRAQSHNAAALLVITLIIMLFGTAMRAQDLEPRSFSPAPKGLNFSGLGYTLSAGDLFFDKALEIEDATGTVHSTKLLYGRTFGLFGKSTKIVGLVPYSWGDWEGLLDGEPASTSRRGFADPGVLFSVGLVGSPAVDLKEFIAYEEGMIIGASVLVIAPLGQYDPSKLINLGANRWVFRPRLGFSGRLKRWTLEAMADAYFFTDNDEAYGGTVFSQDPLYSMQANVIYTFNKGIWLSFTAGIANGGRPSVNGVEKDEIDMNTRIGGVFSVPINRRYSLKMFYTNGIRTSIGTDYDMLGISVQYKWGGGI
jgi:hypothetical protein